MYEYLLNHNYISYNKKPCKDGLYKQKELSVQRARCIANKCDALTIELQEQLSQLQQENKELKRRLDRMMQLYCLDDTSQNTIFEEQEIKVSQLQQEKEETIKLIENLKQFYIEDVKNINFIPLSNFTKNINILLSKLKESENK